MITAETVILRRLRELLQTTVEEHEVSLLAQCKAGAGISTDNAFYIEHGRQCALSRLMSQLRRITHEELKNERDANNAELLADLDADIARKAITLARGNSV